LQRVQRYLERFARLNTGVTHDRNSDYYEDDVYAFFQNCYHLKDWIRHDPDCKGWSSAEDFINQNVDLQICGDLCNSTKHLHLDRRPRSNVEPKFAGKHFDMKFGEGDPRLSVRYSISTQTGSIDAYELASRCVSLWVEFIGKQADRRT
jgi:hypothetical protein